MINHDYAPNMRWNFRMFVLNGAAFQVVNVLLNVNLGMVVFLAHLTDNPILLGMPAALWWGGLSLTQLWASGRLQRHTRSLPAYRMTSLARALLWLVLVTVVAFNDDPAILIVVFMLFLLIYPLIWGTAALVFSDLLGKLIPPRSRSLVLSWRMGTGAVLALGAGWFVNFVLAREESLGFPTNFALIFAAAAVVTIAGVIPFHLLREPDGEPRLPQHSGLRGRWLDIRRIWRENVLYRRYIMARVARLLAGGTTPLIIVYAQARFDLPFNAAAVFLVADTVTGLLSVLVSGWLSVRVGNRWLAMLAMGIGVVVFGSVVLVGPLNLDAGLVFPYFLGVFVLLAAYNSAANISMGALNINIAPPEERPLYLGMAAAISGVAFYLTAAQGAVIPLIGYSGLFTVGLLLMGFALWQIMRLYDPTEADGDA